MHNIILANARYWLNKLHQVENEQPLSIEELRGATKAVETLLALLPDSEAWSLSLELTLSLHLHMQKRGFWEDYKGILHCLQRYAHQQQDYSAEIALLSKYGIVQQLRGNLTEAIQAHFQVWQLARRVTDEKALAIALSNLGYISRQRGEMWRAETLGLAAIERLERLSEPQFLAQTYNLLGLINMDRRQWELADEHFLHAYHLFETLPNNRYEIGRTSYYRSVLHYYLQDWDKALHYAETAQAIFSHLQDEVFLTHATFHIGSIHKECQHWLQAELAYAQAEKLFKRLGDIKSLAHLRHNLGMLYTQLQNWAEAERCFQRATEYWEAHGDPWNQANTRSECAALYLAWGKWEAARACLDIAWNGIGKRQDPRYHNLQREIMEHYAKLGITPESASLK